jgi:hypothetical protein
MPLCNQCRSLSEVENTERCDRCDRPIETTKANPKKRKLLCKLGWHCRHIIGHKRTHSYHGRFCVKRTMWLRYECCKCGYEWLEYDYQVSNPKSTTIPW